MIPMRIMKGTCEISTSALTLTSQPPAFQGEAGALQVQIDFTVDGSAFSPDASIEAQMYLYYPASDVMTPAQTMTISGNKATATLSAEDQATPGAPYLVIQLTDTSGGALIVSCMAPLIIRQTRADTLTDGTAPTPSEVVYVGRAPYLSETNTWVVWDNTSASYVDTGINAIGPQGPMGEVVYGTEAPSALGEASPGVANSAARSDHVHPMPSASNVGALPIVDGAGAHNAIYRGKNLGTVVTAEQFAAIKDGTFRDLYIGDYWVIGGVTWRIAAFDYYLNTGDTACTTHHVTLVPDANMYAHVMNDTIVTTGAYLGSKMYTEGLNQAKETINTAFGAAHVLNHRQYLQNAVTDNYASGGSWYDSTVELMTEQNVYGCKIFGNMLNGTALPNNYTIDKSQYPLFAFRPDLISNRNTFWLRDVVSASYFAIVTNVGGTSYNTASNPNGVRPAFSIIG